MSAFDQVDHPDHGPEPGGRPKESPLTRLMWIVVSGLTIVMLATIVKLGIGQLGREQNAAMNPIAGLWTDEKGGAMFVASVPEGPIWLVNSTLGYRLDVKHRTETIYEGRLICARHQADIGVFVIERATDNTLTAMLLPNGRPRVTLVLRRAD
ncbi:MAG: hypothetical protein HYS13_17735 [Planctomycetia bacterium]|nr:hypothetical protein [Planctomycetia bacterium]